MTSLISTSLSLGSLILGLKYVVATLNIFESATLTLIQESREELMVRRCAANIALRLNLQDGQALLSRISPQQSQDWSQATSEIMSNLNPFDGSSCSTRQWQASVHHEFNPTLSRDYPNWRPRFAAPQAMPQSARGN